MNPHAALSLNPLQIALRNIMMTDRAFEGWVPTPYQDSVGVWTIGMGTTILPDGTRVGPLTPPIDLATGFSYMRSGALSALQTVLDAVTTGLTVGQLSALGSFSYNVGPGIRGERDGFVWLSNGEHSTMLRMLNAGDMAAASAQFPFWDMAGGVPLPGLKKRRDFERAMFLNVVPTAPSGLILNVTGFPEADCASWWAAIEACLQTPEVAMPPQTIGGGVPAPQHPNPPEILSGQLAGES